jgi:hypothetical protein
MRPPGKTFLTLRPPGQGRNTFRIICRDNAYADQESNSGSGVTLPSLLNVLDGVSPREGQVPSLAILLTQ